MNHSGTRECLLTGSGQENKFACDADGVHSPPEHNCHMVLPTKKVSNRLSQVIRALAPWHGITNHGEWLQLKCK